MKSEWLQRIRTQITIIFPHSCVNTRRKELFYRTQKKKWKKKSRKKKSCKAKQYQQQQIFFPVLREGKALTQLEPVFSGGKIREKVFPIATRCAPIQRSERENSLFREKAKILCSCCMCQSGCVGFRFDCFVEQTPESELEATAKRQQTNAIVISDII